MEKDCLFCRIVSGEQNATIVHQDDQSVAFEDINPQAPTHVLVVPREHVASVVDLEERHEAVVGHLYRVAAQVAKEKGIEDGFRLVVNNGAKVGQSVFHLHVHVLGGRGMQWPPG